MNHVDCFCSSYNFWTAWPNSFFYGVAIRLESHVRLRQCSILFFAQFTLNLPPTQLVPMVHCQGHRVTPAKNGHTQVCALLRHSLIVKCLRYGLLWIDDSRCLSVFSVCLSHSFCASRGSCDLSLNSARDVGQGFFVKIMISLQIREL